MDLNAALARGDELNRDNVTRTAAYLEFYGHTVEREARDRPWLLMAHLVSRNAGYLMSDLARPRAGVPVDALRELFLFLERANFLIFADAWEHVLRALAGLPHDARTPRFMRDAWARELATPDERRLVLDLVHNEQHFIERRVVHAPRFEMARQMVAFIEASGREKPIALPLSAVEIRVGGFADIVKRIDTGRRIFDEVLADRDRRRAIYEWALAHPHTGDRALIGGRASPPIVDAWPLATVLALDPAIHAPAEIDPSYP